MSRRKKISVTSETIAIAAFCAVLAVVTVTFSLRQPAFLSSRNLMMLAKHLSITALVGLGLTFVIVVGFADMSFPYVSCLSGMTMSFLIAKGLSPVPCILIGCLVGLVFGVVNGVMVGTCKLPDMVATIGVGSIAYGMAYLYSRGSYIFENFATSGIGRLNDANPLGIPLPAVIALAAYVLGYLLLHRSRYGRRFYATGGGRTAAVFSGVNVNRYVIAAFVLCGVLASLTNMIQIAAQGNGNVKGGLVLLMPAYAAVFVGISVFKRPTVAGTFLGALLIGLMQNGFTLQSVPFYLMNLVVGLVLIAAIVVSKTDFKEIVRRRRLKAATGSR